MKMKLALAATLIVLTPLFLAGCGDDPQQPEEKGSTTAETPEVKTEPEEKPAPPQVPKPGEIQADRIATRHIMLVFEGSPLEDFAPGRSKEEALELAKKLEKRIEDGEDMEKLVAEFSNDPDRGSNRGLRRVRNFGVAPLDEVPENIDPETEYREFDRALTPEMSDLAFTLKVGEVGITADDLGLFVIRREE